MSLLLEQHSHMAQSSIPFEARGYHMNKDKIVTTGLELTDSWYKIRAIIDQPLENAVRTAKIRVGSKIEIFGAKVETKIRTNHFI